MKALILCAGQGTRLVPHTSFVPKCLVPVCGKPILQYQLDALAGAVSDVIVVTGHLHEHLESFLDGGCTIVRNSDYATTNSLYSLWLAREHVEGEDFLLLNGDVLFDRPMLTTLLEHGAPTALLIDSECELSEGEMNVVTRGGLVTEIGKELPLARANAQSLQMVRFAPDDATLLFERVAELITAGETGWFPTYAYRAIFSRSSMAGAQRGMGSWFEIDTVEDLARAESALSQRAAAA